MGAGCSGDGIRKASPAPPAEQGWSHPDGKLASMGTQLQPRDKPALCGLGLGGAGGSRLLTLCSRNPSRPFQAASWTPVARAERGK